MFFSNQFKEVIRGLLDKQATLADEVHQLKTELSEKIIALQADVARLTEERDELKSKMVSQASCIYTSDVRHDDMFARLEKLEKAIADISTGVNASMKAKNGRAAGWSK